MGAGWAGVQRVGGTWLGEGRRRGKGERDQILGQELELTLRVSRMNGNMQPQEVGCTRVYMKLGR